MYMSFSQEIIQWYSTHKRPLPWRETQDPYKIWLSEIILQQTRVVQGTPYYLKFIKNFPTVFDLASASEEKVLKLWQGLGYYSRARNLHATAIDIATNYRGIFPSDYKTLKALKGVGDYTASAIASFCFNAPEAVLDGNVYRVLSRFLGLDTPINTPAGMKIFKSIALDYCDPNNPSDYNQGIMEFGALQCVPQNPSCTHCPVQQGCVAYQTNQVAYLPVKIPRPKPKKIHHHYLVFLDPNRHTLFTKRVGKGIWEGLYEFPLVVSGYAMTFEQLLEAPLTKSFKDLLAAPYEKSLFNEIPVLHKLTHRHIYAHFWVVETEKPLNTGIHFKEIITYPSAVLISDFINAFKNSYF